MEVEVVKGDITELDVQAIVNPANSGLVMGGGLAGIIKKKGGSEIEKEARDRAPVEVGKAIVTTGGRLPSKHVIHAPTMEGPGEKIPSSNSGLAMRGILECAEKNGINEIAVPGLGTGVGGVSADDAASAMVEELKNFEPETVERVILVGYSDELYRAFKTERDRVFS
ncbi:hypothetical protein AKJ39_00320 [candidate division MSBL1 archaeon SCGC-AAA259J03]|uniref:Macro domain-containing protein n=1 Tax=candidate division MSBL1 archaeon SCGC-AAA259J03 TaxID=1698269 RepID=A0A656YYA3_9EURY|nr:hypothetical protein AKJ39_00320 [candidate division MSBL1 archaeon SCGC-AAA259J03]